jgi:hypothetical protein
MLTSVQPSFQRNVSTIQMAVLGRRAEDIDEFMDQLEATGAFLEVLLTQQDRTDEGLHRGVVRSVYAGSAGHAGDASGAPDEPAAGEPDAFPGSPDTDDDQAPPAGAPPEARSGGPAS